MIREFYLQGFKSYRAAKLSLSSLTMLVGANASGKSNAIEAIRIPSWLVKGRRLDAIMESVQESDVGIRGNMVKPRSCSHAGAWEQKYKAHWRGFYPDVQSTKHIIHDIVVPVLGIHGL